MEVIGLKLPLIKKGDDLVRIILDTLNREHKPLGEGDILVVTEKIVAKSQGRLVSLDSVTPSKKAISLAKKTGKDPRLVELILRESREILKVGPNFIITETKEGFVCANAGIDSSNIEKGWIKLLPKAPDRTAERMRSEIEKATGKSVGIVISDSFGRPFRCGSVGIAIGAAGIVTLWDRRGEADLFGRTLQTTRVAVADCIASAANLVIGDGAEKVPVVLIKGLELAGEGRARDLIREKEQDVFRHKV
ncbi:MAG: coenzyme F420-0:L-glutamate ligase [Candidatus Hydrothermarchaeales archaeon]